MVPFRNQNFGWMYLWVFIFSLSAAAENGYSLWLRYVPIPDTALRNHYRTGITQLVVQGSSATLTAASNELKRGCDSLLNQNTPVSAAVSQDGAIVAGTPSSSSLISGLGLTLNGNKEAYRIKTTTIGGYSILVIASQGETGVLYGVFHLLRLLQTNKTLDNIDITEIPKIKRRLLNHWANLDGSIERGYAGNSLWQWSQLPGAVSSRYRDYARVCASVGISGAVLNNVNNTNNMQILSAAYIAKIAAIANVLRPYGIKVYLSAYFNAPLSITTSAKGTCANYDPTDPAVIAWWESLANDLYAAIPDFGGFLVKAGSEGQPGPGTYNRTHAQGANCIAAALAPHGGVCLWRTFVYNDAIDSDRMKRAYKEFRPLDSVNAFRSNVILQTKNGPFDFQPREPLHPLFGGLMHTHVGMEFQVTLEYLGQDVHLVYMGPYWKEQFDFDTHAKGAGSTVGKVVDGTVYGDTESCISGVSNIGDSTNWCGHDFHQANWFAFGRLAWNHDLSPDSIADDWARMTWGNSPDVVRTVTAMMAGSREACVNYMTPLGLCGIFNHNNHYGPEPDWNGDATHPDWNSVYWHKADASGVGYDRTTATGSNFAGQYFPENRDKYNSIATTPPEYLAVFHHVSWSYIVPSTGRSFWNELCYRYCAGCQYVSNLVSQWNSLNGKVDAPRWSAVSAKLAQHLTNANSWRTTCTNYFKSFSGMPITSCSTEALPPAVNNRPAASLPQGNNLKIYNLRGKLVAVLPVKPGVSIAGDIEKKLKSGIYLVRQSHGAALKIIGIGR